MPDNAVEGRPFYLKAILFYTFLLFIFACKGKQQQASEPAPPLLTKDSTRGKDDTLDSGNIYYHEMGKLDLKNFYISVQSKYTGADNPDETGNQYFDGNYLFVRNKKTSRTDTLKLESTDQDLSNVLIEDLADSLHFKSPFLNLSWTGDSDAPWNELAGYRGDSLKSFCVIYSLQSLRRKDESTLTGFVGDRDEVVSTFQYDYPVTISLKDYTVTEEQPSKQYIGYITTALETIKAYRMLSPKDSILYTIKKGTEVRVDTFYRSAGIVRLVISDSIIIHIRLKTANEKLQPNAAG